jgi:hypothetical protein
MANESVIKLFEGKQVRIVWDEEDVRQYEALPPLNAIVI